MNNTKAIYRMRSKCTIYYEHGYMAIYVPKTSVGFSTNATRIICSYWIAGMNTTYIYTTVSTGKVETHFAIDIFRIHQL